MSPYHGSNGKIKNNDSSRMEFLDVVLEFIVGKSHISLAKTKDFFDLMNSKSKSYRMMFHLEYFPPRN